MNKLEPFRISGFKREILYFKLGNTVQILVMANHYNSAIELYSEIYLNDCFELWFEYYGVGE